FCNCDRGDRYLHSFPTRRSSDLICTPLEGLDPQQVAASASIKNLFRVLPSFVGGGLISVLIERRTDARFDSMRQLLTPNRPPTLDRKRTRLNSSHLGISYAVFCL